MKRILNLTQHAATAEQLAAGVIDLPSGEKAELRKLLTFDTLPTKAEIEDRAVKIARLAWYYCQDLRQEDRNLPPVEDVMIGGAPFLMSALERTLETTFQAATFQAVYAFSRMESFRHAVIFRHAGFIPA